MLASIILAKLRRLERLREEGRDTFSDNDSMTGWVGSAFSRLRPAVGRMAAAVVAPPPSARGSGVVYAAAIATMAVIEYRSPAAATGSRQKGRTA
jgi:hypothetical protein